MLDGFKCLERERSARGLAQLTALAMLVHFLPRALDGVLLGVQQVLHEQDQLDLAPLVDAVARTVLRGIEEAEPQAERDSGEPEHAAELAAAEDADDHPSRGSGRSRTARV